jgi:hypothetical protein
MWAAPLFMSTDLRDLSPEAKEILLNKNYIAIMQDPLWDMAVRVDKVQPQGAPVRYAYLFIQTFPTISAFAPFNFLS